MCLFGGSVLEKDTDCHQRAGEGRGTTLFVEWSFR